MSDVATPPGGTEQIHTAAEVDAAFDRIAAAIHSRLHDRQPLVLPVMMGGLIPAGELLRRMDFPLDLDYIHATRYRGGTEGKELKWRAYPQVSLAGRVVLVIDDILDEGATLAAIVDYCHREGVEEVLTAVLVDKQHPRQRHFESADFSGLEVDDRYVFGSGMDYHGRYRNLRGIYALHAEKDLSE